MDFASSITLKFNDLFSNGILQAQNNVLGLQNTLEGITGQGIGEIKTEISALGTALDGINPTPISGIGEAASTVIPPLAEIQNSVNGITGQGIGEIKTEISSLGTALDGINPTPLSGIGEAANAVIPPLTEVQNSVNGITGQGIGEIQTEISVLGTALDGINPTPLSGIGEAASTVIPPLAEVQNSVNGITGRGIGEIQTEISSLGTALDGINPAPINGIGAAVDAIIPSLAGIDEELAFPQAQNAFDDIGEKWEEAIPYLAYLEEEAIADYLHAQNAFADISESWEDAIPKMSGLGAALSGLKTDTITQAKVGFAEMHAAMEQINANPMNQVATQLSIMANMTQPMRDALSAMIDEPSKLAGTFDSSFRNIQSLLKGADVDFVKMKSDLLSIGSNAVAGPNAIADAFYNITSGVGDATVRMDTLRAAVALAESGQADLGSATSGLISVVNAYGTSAENMSGLSDVFFQTVKKGVGSLGGFVSSMSSIAGLSANVNVGFDELGSAMAFVTAKGQTESVAATQLKAAMTTLLNPNKELSEALQSVGIASGSAMLQEYGLVESLNIVKAALGGSQDRMAKALGSTEALQAALVLTGDGYRDFATAFSADLSGAAAGGLEAQVLSYESKVARLQAASDALKIQIGEDVNGIKGFFIDIETGFLQHVAAPLLSSPVGGVFSAMAAGAAVVGQTLLTTGSAALNAAAQFSVLAANISNAGGYAKFMGGAMTALGAPFKAIGSFGIKLFAPLVGGLWSTLTASVAAAGGVGAFAAAMWAAAWPVLAVVAAVALVGAGAYMLIKHWDTVVAFFVNLWNRITGVFAGLPNWVVGLIAVFLPFIGIPILIIKNWDTIKDFFASLWNRITGLFAAAWEWIKGVFSGLPNWVVGLLAVFFPFISIPILIIAKWDAIKGFFASLWENVKTLASGFVTWFTGLWPLVVSAFMSVWEQVKAFFVSLWEGIVSTVVTVANAINSAWTAVVSWFTAAWGYVYTFFSGIWQGIVSIVFGFVEWIGTVWTPVVSVFTIAWGYVYDFFNSIWEGIKGVVLGFIEWISPAVELIIAPFKKVAEVVGGILDGIGGFFRELIGESDTAGDKMGENLAKVVQGDSAVGQPSKVLPQSTMAKPEVAKPDLLAKSSVMPAPDTAAVAVIPVPDAVTVPALNVGQSATVTGTNAIAGSGTAGSKPAGISLSPAKMNSPAVTYGASTAFESAMGSGNTATLAPSMDTATINGQAAEALATWNAANTVSLTPGMEDITQQAAITFPEAMPAKQPTVQESPERRNTQTRNTTPPQIKIEHLTVQAEDCETMFDFYRTLLHTIYQPEEAAV